METGFNAALRTCAVFLVLHLRHGIRTRCTPPPVGPPEGMGLRLAGAYFVTVCTHTRECVFGEVKDGRVVSNDVGKIVGQEWNRSAEIRQEVHLDSFVIMPNHFHGIVWITSNVSRHSVGATGRSPLRTNLRPHGPSPKSLAAFIAGFKSAATRRVNALRQTPGYPLWQRNYYEHILRDEAELSRAREYVLSNALKWDEDEKHPGNAPGNGCP